ncbi:MAG: phosphate acyltransferase PlsX [Candidatus Omnitrophica bacterium]|jgi:glycerol-3-phosphate acyltransferase PlsX|nr:phosphate acyltransferase PlsX [Candidatus Omnitrophota bacterium]MDD5078849.1 phosphate acyltransferase PlsX [Candidatus Omnitrophota bacterium]
MKIIVDAMGGDYASDVVVDGAIAAVKEYQVGVVLVGDEAKIRMRIRKMKFDSKLLSVYPASEVIEMHDSPATSVRRKRNSSIVLGLKLVRDGQGDAFFSAGNTGAVVCASTLTLGMLPGIERPGIATLMPSLKGVSLIIDVGANIDPKPLHILQYAVMADAYARYILHNPNPRVGLLNVGEEESKGTVLLKDIHESLSKTHLNFIGNVEGRHLFSGDCDIIVCDGFVGNVALKVTESLAEAMQISLKKHIFSNPLGIIGGLLLRSSFRAFKKEIDYSEYGGAPLLGVNGVSIIGHGRSNAKAIKNAIRVAKEEVENRFNEKVLEAINLEGLVQTKENNPQVAPLDK